MSKLFYKAWQMMLTLHVVLVVYNKYRSAFTTSALIKLFS